MASDKTQEQLIDGLCKSSFVGPVKTGDSRSLTDKSCCICSSAYFNLLHSSIYTQNLSLFLFIPRRPVGTESIKYFQYVRPPNYIFDVYPEYNPSHTHYATNTVKPTIVL